MKAVLLGLKGSVLDEGSANFLTAILMGSGLYSGNLLRVLLYPSFGGLEGLNGPSCSLGNTLFDFGFPGARTLPSLPKVFLALINNSFQWEVVLKGASWSFFLCSSNSFAASSFGLL